jgi:hypothetical protein
MVNNDNFVISKLSFKLLSPTEIVTKFRQTRLQICLGNRVVFYNPPIYLAIAQTKKAVAKFKKNA